MPYNAVHVQTEFLRSSCTNRVPGEFLESSCTTQLLHNCVPGELTMTDNSTDYDNQAVHQDQNSKPANNEITEPVHYNTLQSSASISVIGLIAARMLKQHQQVTLMVSTDGMIEVVPVGELELDSLDEEIALQNLLQRSYTDQQLADYLRQRAIRLAVHR